MYCWHKEPQKGNTSLWATRQMANIFCRLFQIHLEYLIILKHYWWLFLWVQQKFGLLKAAVFCHSCLIHVHTLGTSVHFFETKLIDTAPYCFSSYANIVECRYNAVQYNTMMAASLQWMMRNINRCLNPKRHLISRPSGRFIRCLLWGFWRKLTAL